VLPFLCLLAAVASAADPTAVETVAADSTVAASAAAAVQLPPLSGENLVEEQRSLPADLDADRSVVVMAFKKRQQVDTDACYPGVSTAAQAVGAAPWELLMLPTSMPRFARPLMRHGLIRATEEGPRQERKLMVFGDVDASRAALGIGSPDQVQILVVDRQGQVRWRQAGPCTPALLDGLTAALADGEPG